MDLSSIRQDRFEAQATWLAATPRLSATREPLKAEL
jgi:hypothetical protein